VLLTTQYLEEADQLADRIAVIDHGQVIAEGTSGELKASVGAGALHVRLRDPDRRAEGQQLLSRTLGVQVHLDSDPVTLTASVEDPERVARALTELSRASVEVAEFSLGQPSLDEVFFALTGHPAEETNGSQPDGTA
jgi:ABC-2 type transport system ATP-binding protein